MLGPPSANLLFLKAILEHVDGEHRGVGTRSEGVDIRSPLKGFSTAKTHISVDLDRSIGGWFESLAMNIEMRIISAPARSSSVGD